jgi:oligogalacturonide transporter
MGYISDHTRTRFGRRRIYFLWGLLPIFVSFSLLWLPVQVANPRLTFLYYALCYLVFSTVFTMVMVPYSALNAEMSRDYRERTRLSAARIIFSGMSALIVSVVPPKIIDGFSDPHQGHLVMGLVFGLFFSLPWLLVYVGTWELATVPEKAVSSVSHFWQNMRSIFINRSFRIHLGMYISAYSAIDILMALILYYMTYYFARKELFTLCIGAMGITQLVMLIVYVAMANRYGKGPAYLLGLTLWAMALFVGLSLRPEASNASIIFIFILAGAGLVAGQMIPWAILPSVTDVDELITGQQRAGIYAGSMTLIRKLVQALILFAVGLTLEKIGYIPGVAQAPATLEGLRLFFFSAQLVFIALGLLCATRFKITPQRHRLLTQELARLKAGGAKKDAEEQTRTVCEALTGVRYEKLYQPFSPTTPPAS